MSPAHEVESTTPEVSAPGSGPALPRGSRFPRLMAGEYAPIWVATAVLFALSAAVAPNSLSSASLGSTLAFTGVLAIVAIGQTLIVQQRGIDLSVPGVVTLCAMVLPIFMARADVPLIGGLGAVLVTAVVIGLLNGLLVTKLSITPLIATLAVNSLLLGATLSYTRGLPSAAAPASLQSFAGSKLLGISVIMWLAAALVAVVALAMRFTVVGRRFVAVGTSAPAARAGGVSGDRYVIAAYVLGAVFFATAAVLLVGYLQSATVRTGGDYLFPSIAAVVVGGTSLAGGKGSAIASGVAALFLTQLVQVLLTLGAPTSSQFLAQAVAIAVAAAALPLWRAHRG
jgi:ribose transport system permease protein